MISHGVEISIAGGGADEKDEVFPGSFVTLYTVKTGVMGSGAMPLELLPRVGPRLISPVFSPHFQSREFSTTYHAA